MDWSHSDYCGSCVDSARTAAQSDCPELVHAYNCKEHGRSEGVSSSREEVFIWI